MIAGIKNTLAEAIGGVLATIDFLGQEPLVWALAGAIPTATWLTAVALTQILEDEDAWQLRIVRFFSAFSTWTIETLAGIGGAILVVSVLSAAWVHSESFASEFRDYLIRFGQVFGGGIVAGIVLGITGRIWVGRHFEKMVLGWIHGSMKTETDPETEHSDIREIDKYLPDAKNITIDHIAAFKRARKKNCYWLGVDEHDKDVLIPRDIVESTHIQVAGGSGRGKGVQATILLIQALFYGHAIFIFDPKRDAFMSRVWAAVCEKAGLPFYFADIRSQAAQLNLLKGVNREQLEDILIVGLNLRRAGKDSDFYKIFERDVVYRLAEIVDQQTDITFQSILDFAPSVLTEEELQRSESLLLQIQEIARVEAINTIKGPDIAELLSTGGVFFLRGDEERENLVLVEKMFVLRVMQLLKNRTAHQNKHAFMQLDELPVIASASSIAAFSLIRDKHCSLVVTHQTPADFNSVPGMDATEAWSKVENNCGIKWLYGSDNAEYRKWASEKSGSIRVKKKRHQITTNAMNVELKASELTIDEDTRQRVDENMILALPKFCALCVCGAETRLAFTHPFFIPLKDPVISPVAPYPRHPSVAEEFSSDSETRDPISTEINTPEPISPGDEFL